MGTDVLSVRSDSWHCLEKKNNRSGNPQDKKKHLEINMLTGMD